MANGTHIQSAAELPKGTIAVPSDTASLPGRVFGPVLDGQTWRSFAYLLISLATGIAYFTIAVTGISVSAGLAVTIVGLPLLVGFLALVRTLSVTESRLIQLVLGQAAAHAPLASRTLTAEAPAESITRRVLFWFKDRRTWSTLLYLVLQLPLGTIYFSLVVGGLWTSVWLVASPITQPVLERWQIPLGAGRHLVFEPWAFPLLVLAGAALFLVTVHGARSLAQAHARYASAMLLAPAEGAGLPRASS
jgi:hypothetical protein